MLSRILKLTLVAIFVLSPSVAMARHMLGGKWWRNPEVAKQITLSDEEKNKLDALYLESRRKLIDLKRDVKRERLEFEYLLEKETLDEQAIMKRFEKLEKARNALATERFRFLLQIRKTVGYERFQQLKAMHRKFRRHDVRGPRGGPRGPRGPRR